MARLSTSSPLLAGVVGSESETRPGGTRWYVESATVGLHTLVAWTPRKPPNATETYFEVRQSALDELGGVASLALAGKLLDARARFSRADGYLDDRGRQAEPAGYSRTHGGVVTSSPISDGCRSSGSTRRDRDGQVIPDGSTVYIGSPKSEGMLRVYDKAAESGRVDAGIRWELQVLRGAHAARFVTGAVAAGNSLGAYVSGCIRGLVDFRDRSGQERGDRAPMLDWWAELVADAARVGLSGPARVDSLEKRGAWLSRQAAPSLALLAFAYGAGWLDCSATQRRESG